MQEEQEDGDKKKFNRADTLTYKKRKVHKTVLTKMEGSKFTSQFSYQFIAILYTCPEMLEYYISLYKI